ncbi:MAG: twin-arginine translocation signal domain-containing protein, partial [Verrucomicrobiae bacterium]|nr:twin-arginine translocation signal domain-containing protein [Verrucomicrobiae bacterium]
MSPMTRRDFLRATAATGLAAALPQTALPETEMLGGRGFCLATYGFRHFTGPQAVEMTKSMGVTLMDLWPKLASSLGGGKKDNAIKAYHENPELWAEMKAALDRHGVRAVVYGVQRFTSNHEENRKIFDWARQNGIETFGAAP